MPETRSASQILFGYLPEQTVDVRGGVWKVHRWREPSHLQNVDSEALKREICRVASPWEQAKLDGGLVDDLTQSRAGIRVLVLDRERGIELDPFPQVWICKGCNRIHYSPDSVCMCGHSGRKGQLHFVGYCEACAAVREPWIPSCAEHKQAKVTFPGTASGAEILFSCPVCHAELRRGFGFPACDCGGGRLRFTVHRAASVYSARGVVLVNPPSTERIALIEEGGGAQRALAWIFEGMPKEFVPGGKPTVEALRQRLQQQGLSDSVISEMLAVAKRANGLAAVAPAPTVPEELRTEIEAQALTVALGVSGGRLTFEDLKSSVPETSALSRKYVGAYPRGLSLAGLDRVDFVENFPVLTGYFGFTRGSFEPGQSRLRAFRETSGDYVVYGDVAETEALFVQLSPQRVARWMGSMGSSADRAEAYRAVLNACTNIDTAQRLTTLVHSYAHRFIRVAALHAGIERNSLAELLVPMHFGFFIYAAAKGDFVLGGLQAVFESDVDQLLHQFVDEDHRCPLDPGCARAGSACVACLHLGEPSCRHFNTNLDREVLSGTAGYLRVQ